MTWFVDRARTRPMNKGVSASVSVSGCWQVGWWCFDRETTKRADVDSGLLRLNLSVKVTGRKRVNNE